MKKLKPVVFIKGEYEYHKQNSFQQNLLLKALQITTDPQELRKMIGVKTVADVYRTLDKLAMRREYQVLLAEKGIDLNTIIDGIKEVCDNADSTPKGLAVKLKGYQTFLRSLGLDEYKDDIGETKRSWEDILKEHIEKQGKLPPSQADYEVIAPETPEEEQKKLDQEKKLGQSLYDNT